ncbi:immunoglobulin superfamily member 8-like, partial [Scleropages formosus]
RRERPLVPYVDFRVKRGAVERCLTFSRCSPPPALRYATCREVALPPGPLYRVAGFPLSLPCSVSGYEGSRTQDFEWYLYREDSGGRQIGVISTRDRGFSYAPYQPRVRSGEVRVERESGDQARLVVQRLRPEDQGRYECYTPSTDSRYQGNYSASVSVKVIPDTLQISHSRSLSGQPLTEGAELQLTCEATVRSKQHTHLSVTFGVRGGSVPGSGAAGQGHNLREIVSIGRDLGVAPGRAGDYEQRYGEGEISLEKRKGPGDRTVYVMRMAAVAPGDSGAYFCEATQWIMDPDGGWERIAQRTMELGNLTVQPLADTLTVTTVPRGEVTLPAGSPLSLTCVVRGVGAWNRSALLVQWMKRGAASGEDGPGVGAEVEVARLGPDGAVSWGDDVSRRGGGSMEKEAEGRYSLRLFSAHPSNSGVYRCTVSVFAGRRNPGPSSPATVTQRSDGVSVTLRIKGRREAETCSSPRGDTVAVMCNVSVATTGPFQVEVRWWQKRDEPEGPEEESAGDGRGRVLAVLTYEGFSLADLLLIPLVVGVSSALFVGVLIVATVTCCFMNRLARQRSPK